MLLMRYVKEKLSKGIKMSDDTDTNNGYVVR